jgi:hypothetical protein
VLGESIDIICPKYRGHSLQMKYGYGMVDNGKNIILKTIVKNGLKVVINPMYSIY